MWKFRWPCVSQGRASPKRPPLEVVLAGQTQWQTDSCMRERPTVLYEKSLGSPCFVGHKNMARIGRFSRRPKLINRPSCARCKLGLAGTFSRVRYIQAMSEPGANAPSAGGVCNNSPAMDVEIERLSAGGCDLSFCTVRN